VADQDALDEDAGRVCLMSVHAAKGLEFPCVLIAGAEDELFPHARSVDDPNGEEEERRLFYVAMTRAMERLAITHTARRFDWRGDAPRLPTPYLQDVPRTLLEHDDRAHTWGSVGSIGYDRPRPPEEFGFVREVEADLTVGDRVRHPYFGEGRLADLHGGGADLRVTIDFDDHGRKQLLLSHARLERCP
jgi:DNA helicase-2/ATP-dependent DNA helicase PcrA